MVAQLRSAKLVSLVCPMLNEAESVGLWHAAVVQALQALPVPYELVVVDDGSIDDTWAQLVTLQAQYGHLKLIRLSRNFGKEAALTAGLAAAQGDVMVPIDADLQDPPALVPAMYDKWQHGADMVVGVRPERPSDSAAKRLSSGAFYRVFNWLSPQHIPLHGGDFRLMDKAVVQALLALPERTRFMKGLYGWVGFKTELLPYERPERAAGQSKFNGWKLWNFALEGLLSFSTWPLRVWTYVGASLALVSLAYGTVVVVQTLLFGRALPGYASLMVAVLFLGGIQLLTLGIIGEYIGRIYLETKQRPLFVVKEQRG